MENRNTKLLQSNIKVMSISQAGGSQIDSFGSSNDGQRMLGQEWLFPLAKDN